MFTKAGPTCSAPHQRNRQRQQPGNVLMSGGDHILAAQYPNGGWSQFFPLRKGYHSRITYNDSAMIGLMTLLRETAAGKEPLSFVSMERQTRHSPR